MFPISPNYCSLCPELFEWLRLERHWSGWLEQRVHLGILHNMRGVDTTRSYMAITQLFFTVFYNEFSTAAPIETIPAIFPTYNTSGLNNGNDTMTMCNYACYDELNDRELNFTGCVEYEYGKVCSCNSTNGCNDVKCSEEGLDSIGEIGTRTSDASNATLKHSIWMPITSVASIGLIQVSVTWLLPSVTPR